MTSLLKRRRWAILAALGVSAAGLTGYASAARQAPPRYGHIWVIVLENKGYAETFGPTSKAPYLAKQLPKMGRLLTKYYGTGHQSLDNYVSMVSGQGANIVTQSDCLIRPDFLPAVPLPGGQFLGQGCVYPASVPTVAGQLESKKLSWRGYMEDMGNDPAREPAACGVPKTDAIGRDLTQSATKTDQYAARHNPFVYFHAITDAPTCAQRVVPLTKLAGDLSSARTTPSFSFITPDLCSDGHDTPCVDGRPGGLASEDAFLKSWVPKIMASPAFKKDGLIVVTYDESETSDASACCGTRITPNTPMPGITGAGGGLVGAILLSPRIKGATTDATGYDHFSLLRTIEDNFGLTSLGFASAAQAFKP